MANQRITKGSTRSRGAPRLEHLLAGPIYRKNNIFAYNKTLDRCNSNAVIVIVGPLGLRHDVE